MEITKASILADYQKIRKIAYNSLNRNQLLECMKQLSILGEFMYNFNIIFSDDEAESILQILSQKMEKNSIYKSIKKFKNNSDNKIIIFYDWFALDKRGLSVIYLKALLQLGYHIKYITYNKNSYRNMKMIRELIKSDPESVIYKIDDTDWIVAINELKQIIVDINPKMALIHTTPYDIIGLVAFSSFRGLFDRFLINITDHAFWLGASVFDYIIEFRSYGYNLSNKYRNISKEKLIILPYYPETHTNEIFRGFPFDEKGKKVIFSGGNFSKIRGSSLFYKVIKHIIDKHDDTIFLYAGSGDKSDFMNFIRANKYKNRVYCISERDDLSEIMKRCYFYLSTYPISGGLMSQYAIVNGKLPIALRKEVQLFTDTESILLHSNGVRLDYTNVREYIHEIDRLLNNPEYLLEKGKELKELIISPQDFTKELNLCLNLYRTSFDAQNIDIDIQESYKIYLNNINNKEYIELLFKLGVGKVFCHFPLKILYYYINDLCQK